MKKIISGIVLITILAIFTISYADTLAIDVTTDKSQVGKGEKVSVNIDWHENMQAVDFILQYDNTKVKLIGAGQDLSEDYYNNNEQFGKISVVWASLDDSEKSNLSFEFETIESGNAEFKVIVDGGFANAKLEIPDDYTEGVASIEITEFNFIILGIIIVAIIVIAIIVVLIIKMKK